MIPGFVSIASFYTALIVDELSSILWTNSPLVSISKALKTASLMN